MFSLLTVVLIIVLILVLSAIILYDYFTKMKITETTEETTNEASGLKEPPSPMRLPIIGHMHLMGGYDVPYQAFAELGKKFGNVIKLQLGTVKCVVVNEQKNIREALVTKGHHFDSRPNFERYQRLFSGSKENCEYIIFIQGGF